MLLSDLSIKQPVFATMIAVSLMALGAYSYRELSVDLFPDVEIPVLTVQTVYTGSSPETVEREVTKRIEEAFHCFKIDIYFAIAIRFVECVFPSMKSE